MKVLDCSTDVRVRRLWLPRKALDSLGFSLNTLDNLVLTPIDKKGELLPFGPSLRVAESLFPFLKQDLDWLLERIVLHRSTAKFKTSGLPAFSDKESKDLNDLLSFVSQAFSREEIAIQDLGLAVTMLFLLYDLLRARGPRYEGQIGFFKEGHLFGSLGSAFFVVCRESGGRVRAGRDGCSHLEMIDGYTDSDGSYACGFVSLREVNPYLLQAWQIISQRYSSKSTSLDKDQLDRLARTVPWIQYYLSVLSNRVRFRHGRCSTLAHCRPLDSLPGFVKGYLQDLRVTPDVIEIYAGNLGRLKIDGALASDMTRVRSSGLASQYFSDYYLFKKRGGRS